MREDARFIVWASGFGTVTDNFGKGFEINEARVAADKWIKENPATISRTGVKLYLLRMEHTYVPPKSGGWETVG